METVRDCVCKNNPIQLSLLAYNIIANVFALKRHFSERLVLRHIHSLTLSTARKLLILHFVIQVLYLLPFLSEYASAFPHMWFHNLLYMMWQKGEIILLLSIRFLLITPLSRGNCIIFCFWTPPIRKISFIIPVNAILSVLFVFNFFSLFSLFLCDDFENLCLHFGHSQSSFSLPFLCLLAVHKTNWNCLVYEVRPVL